MTKLLVSVRNAAEARAALCGGADIIDVKEPARGAMGRPDAEALSAVLDAVGKQRPISVALGELAEEALPLTDPRIRWQKLALAGLAGTDWRKRVREVAGSCPDSGLILVAYADASRAGAPDWAEVLDEVCRQPCAGLLIDTWGKDGRGLFEWLDETSLREAIAACRNAGRIIALAGGLTWKGVARAAVLAPDIVAVRGAACVAGSRTAAVGVQAVRRLRRAADLGPPA